MENLLSSVSQFLIYKIIIVALISLVCYKCDNNDKNIGKNTL